MTRAKGLPNSAPQMRFMFVMIFGFLAVAAAADYAFNRGHYTEAALKFMGF